ncbi:dihydrolipoyl dehydrogenase [bacterium]|nr:dihydrolipoyl dehydrogenase [bacterium]MBU1959533.1 dihydrolipoyl dehydrogenase [bacterium]
MREYDVVVIGAGPGGYEAALKVADGGKKTLLIDRSKEHIGGVCLNVGCIPTKSYLQSANFVLKAPYFKACGVSLEIKGFDLNQLREKTISLVKEIRSGVVWLLDQAKVELLYGSASFVDAHTIEVLGEKIGFEKCVIATGSHARELPQLPFDAQRILSSTDIFGLKSLPKSIAIVGGGSIACEFATFFNALGIKVTMIIRGTQLLSKEDEDISKALLRAFKKRNIEVITSATISKSIVKDESVVLFVRSYEDEQIECDIVLNASGRIPYSEGLNLEQVNVKQDTKGFIEVEASFQTSHKNIYAIGDCINTPAFAHTAYAEARITAQNILDNNDKTNTHMTPTAVFSNPAVASCGLNEIRAKEQEIKIVVKKVYFKVNVKAKINGDDSGFVKIIVSADNGVILGASIIGTEATEIIHEMLIAIEKKLTIQEIEAIIHVHPSVSEIMR